MRLLIFNLAMDLDDDLAFAVRWVQGLAERVEAVRVITMRGGRVSLPANVEVHSVGKENGSGEPRRVVEFYRHLGRILRRERIDVCFSHMIPEFTVLAGPVLRAVGIPIVTWYAHREVTPTLKLAYLMSSRMVASNRSAYRYRHDKSEFIGQGIDTSRFAAMPGAPEEPPLLLSVGRLSPIKDLLTLVDAMALLRKRGREVRCAIVGEAPERDREYAEALRARVSSLMVEGMIDFVGRVPSDEVPDWHRRSFAHVNLCPTGAVDKAALEAMACARPSLVANQGFAESLGEWSDRLQFRHGDATDLADKVEGLLDLSPVERRVMGESLRARVVAQHDLERLLDRLVDIFTRVGRR